MTDGRRGDDSGATPTSAHTRRYVPGLPANRDDGRLYSEVFPRNAPPLVAALTPYLYGRRGRVLEIGSGTGQHAAAFDLAFPGISWWASDPEPAHRDSASAWRSQLGLPPRPALDIDAAGAWAAALTEIGPFEAVYSANVIHISPVSVMEGIVREASHILAPCGLLIFYGPFTEGGKHNSDGNAVFDKRLRADDPEWGLRDLHDLRDRAQGHGLQFVGLQAMPANNRLVIYRKP